MSVITFGGRCIRLLCALKKAGLSEMFERFKITGYVMQFIVSLFGVVFGS